MNRRTMLKLGVAGAVTFGLTRRGRASKDEFEVAFTEEEWRSMLDDLEYAVMREEATERPYSSPLNDEKRAGVFHCRGCDLPLYDASTKYESGTGWPSFWEPLPDAVAFKRDYKLVFPRIEVHCRRCGSHLGHVFNDGPPPTGERHCLNGVALTFKPA